MRRSRPMSRRRRPFCGRGCPPHEITPDDGHRRGRARHVRRHRRGAVHGRQSDTAADASRDSPRPHAEGRNRARAPDEPRHQGRAGPRSRASKARGRVHSPTCCPTSRPACAAHSRSSARPRSDLPAFRGFPTALARSTSSTPGCSSRRPSSTSARFRRCTRATRSGSPSGSPSRTTARP